MNQPAPTPQETSTRARAQLDAMLEPILGNAINGLLVTVQGIAPEHLAKSIARVTGTILGRVVQQGPIISILQVRAAMKGEFSCAMDAVTPAPPPATPTPPQG